MPAEPASRHFASQRLRLHYSDWGNAAAPPLILLHGGNDHGRSWDRVAEALRDRFHVVAPDLRGHGDSDWAPDGHYSPTANVTDLAALVEALGGGPVTFVAHSFGGKIALRHAGLFPGVVAKLVVIEGLGPSPEWETGWLATPVERRIRDYIERQRILAARPPQLYDSVEAAAERMVARNPRLSAAQALHLTTHALRRHADGRHGWKFDPCVRPMSPIDILPEERDRLWSAIECPILLIHGAESWVADPAGEERLRLFRDVRTVTLAGAGHWVHHDRPDAFLATVTAFLG